MNLKSKTMNKLLNPISWSAYLETIAVLAIVYYACIGWKFYRPEISRFIDRITGRDAGKRELPEALQYQGDAAPESPTADRVFPADKRPRFHEEPLLNHFELAHQLTECIEAATEKPFAPAILIQQMKKILNDYPDVAAKPEREKINALIVRECEKTGTALLSESEVDMWWSA